MARALVPLTALLLASHGVLCEAQVTAADGQELEEPAQSLRGSANASPTSTPPPTVKLQEECRVLERFNATIQPGDYRKISVDLDELRSDGFAEVVVASNSLRGDRDLLKFLDRIVSAVSSRVIVASNSILGDADIFTFLDRKKWGSESTVVSSTSTSLQPSCLSEEGHADDFEDEVTYRLDGNDSEDLQAYNMSLAINASLLEAYIVPFGNDTAQVDVVVYVADDECERPVERGWCEEVSPGSGWIFYTPPCPPGSTVCGAGPRPGPERGGFEQPDQDDAGLFGLRQETVTAEADQDGNR
ncbi:unnamed protein product [Vitrella brassicaformis CCMP3155]|uniref:Uncharacterized protein n=1 Tax=Vitrella brassicaformis (strain CCMP3155) TaxID=1169540 RepID=A0A0G4G1U1_VITBC|nr:unnamed protein product [Vitrella brassicaformis CCMP3155]|mmetsp:Transcript_21296/g.52077  ORF Transcript_21296/g.52077 Transcript_21296/m.52077 type:complete len:301 (-) Transcript_21296:301-1203(-)|eukprot:CEM22011.1 unnamed protein product [Vitrella brassicaformis CCMP3155]